jgi:hypothetical protein
VLSTSDSIRVASLFADRTYFLAAAEFGETTNNLVVVLDSNGKWRKFEGVNINTMGIFFNEPIFGSADDGTFFRFFEGLDDDGASIALEIRLRAFDGKNPDFRGQPIDDSNKLKILKEVIVHGKNTGATYTVRFSPDQGTTFLPLLNSAGGSSFTTSSDGLPSLKGFE